MEPAALAEFERTCEIAMGPSIVNPNDRNAAQAKLAALGSDLGHIGTIQAVLDGSLNDYAVTAAAKSLLILVTDHWNSFSEGQRVDIRNYLLTLLANKGPKLQVFSQMQIIQLVCRLTKYAWFDEDPAVRQIVQESNKFLQATFYHCVIGMRLLNELVSEMNYKTKNRTLTQHRKVAVAFRDQALLEVFEISLSMLNNLATKAINLTGLPASEAERIENMLLDQSLALLLGCLNYDFIGVLPDESADEASTLQVPTAWRDRIQNGATLRLLFNLYKGCTTGKIPLIPDAPAPSVAVGSSAPSQPMRDFQKSDARAAQALDCISLIISVRRSLFSSDADRKRFLTHIIRGVCEILRENAGLGDEDCYHHFCRLLSRIKNNFQLAELVRAEGYAEWLDLTAKFTIRACTSAGWSSNSIHYILGLWSKLVSSVPYARQEASMTAQAGQPAPEVLLENYVPQIVGAYVRGRVENLMGPDQEVALEELDDIEVVEDQLEQLPLLCRYQYDAAAGMIQSVLDPLMARYNEALNVVNANPQAAAAQPDSAPMVALRIFECQLAWMVAIVGAIVGGAGANSMTIGASSGDEVHDAELSRRVLTLLAQMDTRLASVVGGMLPHMAVQSPLIRVVRVDRRLETATLYFMEQFRKAFVTDAAGMPPPAPPPGAAASSSSHVALLRSSTAAAGASNSTGMSDGPGAGNSGGKASLEELLENASGRQRSFLVMFKHMGLGDHNAVVTVMLLKLFNNLRYWGEREDIIRRSLDVLHDLVYNFSSGKLLLTIDAVTSVLHKHGPTHFPFLSNPANVRYRTAFYTSLARLVFMEDDSDKFDPFMKPLLDVLEQLAPAVHGRVRNDDVMRALIGSARDVRGVLAGAHNRFSYTQCFDALHPKHLETFIRGLDVWADTVPVTTAILKLIAELVFQRAQRIQFGSNSPNGILLFKAASQAIVSYGSRILPTQPSPDQAYNMKFKGIAICAQIMARCMDAGFVNFGVFQLYSDRAFEHGLDIVLKLLLAVPPRELMSFPKVATQYMTVMHFVCRAHLESLAALPAQMFLQIVRSLSEGLDSLESEIANQAAYALDHLASSYVRNAKKDSQLGQALRTQLQANPVIFQTLMQILFQILVFSETQNQYTLARPMLPIIIAAEFVRPDALEEYKNELVRGQPRDRQGRMEEEFLRLARDITRSLDPTNRDRFAQRLSAFRLTVREFAIM